MEACGREVKTANLAVPDPDRDIRGWGRGGWSSKPLDRCGRGCFGPQFGPKIRVTPPLDPPLLGVRKSRLRVSLDEKLCSTLSLFTQAYDWVPCDILSADGLVFRLGPGDQFPCVFHATLRKTKDASAVRALHFCALLNLGRQPIFREKPHFEPFFG